MDLSKNSYLSFCYLALFSTIIVLELVYAANSPPVLKFKNREFKILQVADMHYADGITTPCEDVLEMRVKVYMSKPKPQNAPAPGLAYFHIPLPEYEDLRSNFTGVKGEGLISSPSVNSGFFTTLRDAWDVKVVFTGHDHLNDFCGVLNGINLCYAGGFCDFRKMKTGKWEAVHSIRTWKRLDDENLTTIDPQVLFT
ncbi:hypothetical protein MKW98_011759, partial [Papaver atlanticum]